jgi:sugar lactone lactonase YvrE
MVDRKGLITTVAGTGVRGFSGEGLLAIEAEFDRPQLGFDAEGNLWVLNHHHPSLLKIDSNGVVKIIAGTGNEGATPEDGARAKDVDLCGVPFGPAIDGEGNIYISCEFGHVVLKIDTEGFIHRFAGTGEPGYAGDGGPASEAQFFSPVGMSIDNEGNLYIAELLNARIRKIDTDGIISTIAGNGTSGYSGDGGPAIEAEIASPLSVAVDGEGNVYFSSHSNKVVRKIDTAGIIHTVAGGGEPGFSVDGGPATSAWFKGAGLGIAVDNEGNLYIADDGAHRVWKVILGSQ